MLTYKTHNLTRHQLTVSCFELGNSPTRTDRQVSIQNWFFQQKLFLFAPSFAGFNRPIIFSGSLDFLCVNLPLLIAPARCYSNLSTVCSMKVLFQTFSSLIIFEVTSSMLCVQVLPHKPLLPVSFPIFVQSTAHTTLSPPAPSLVSFNFSILFERLLLKLPWANQPLLIAADARSFVLEYSHLCHAHQAHHGIIITPSCWLSAESCAICQWPNCFWILLLKSQVTMIKHTNVNPSG